MRERIVGECFIVESVAKPQTLLYRADGLDNEASIQTPENSLFFWLLHCLFNKICGGFWGHITYVVVVLVVMRCFATLHPSIPRLSGLNSATTSSVIASVSAR